MSLNRKWVLAVVCLLAVMLAASAALVQALPQEKEQEEDEPKTEDEKAKQKELEAKACGPEGVKYSAETDKKQHPTPEAPADQALVYVIRPTMSGHKVQTKLAVDGRWVGANRGNNYFYLTLPPGEHYFCSQAENRSVLAVTLEAGRTYYLQQKIRMGWMKARNKLELLGEEEGKKGLAKCHLSISEVKK
jgi:hypothetical protein